MAAANHDRGRDVRARSGVRLATAPHAVEDGACFSYYVGRKENTQREREREREREKAITITIRYADRAIIRFVGCYRLHADVTNKKQNTNASYGNGRRSHDERSFLFLSFSSNETKEMRSKKKKKRVPKASSTTTTWQVWRFDGVRSTPEILMTRSRSPSPAFQSKPKKKQKKKHEKKQTKKQKRSR